MKIEIVPELCCVNAHLVIPRKVSAFIGASKLLVFVLHIRVA
jgi:hypothetical protein